jgi:hypothetical protein
MQRNTEHEARLNAGEQSGLPASKEAMTEPPPPRPPSNSQGLCQGLTGSYAGVDGDRPRLGDALGIPRPEDS